MVHDNKVVFLRPRDRLEDVDHRETDEVPPPAVHQERPQSRRGFAIAMIELLRYLFVVVLIFLRLPIKFALTFFAFGLTAAGVLVYIGYPEGAAAREAMLPWAPVGGFAAFALSYAYDSIVMWLSREQLFLH